MNLVFLFPGQSSADPQMIQRAATLDGAACQVLEQARRTLGDDLIRPYLGSSGARLDSNRDVQIAVFLTTQMHLAALRAVGVDTNCSAGLSLGEYSHLVHIGALSFEAALRLVAARGTVYDTAPPGIMVAVIGPDRRQVEGTIASTDDGEGGRVFVSNYNAPTQHVIAGDRPVTEAVARRLEDQCGAYTVETESNVPMHTPLLQEVADRFRPALVAAPWQRPMAPYLPNVTARPTARDTAAVFVDALTRHVTEPVRWQETLETLHADRLDAAFVEVGPGEVLYNMLGRRWLPVRRMATDAPSGDSLARFRGTVEALRG